MIGEPPSFSGGVHAKLAALSSGVAAPIVGASGADGGGGANVKAIKDWWPELPFHRLNAPPRYSVPLPWSTYMACTPPLPASALLPKRLAGDLRIPCGQLAVRVLQLRCVVRSRASCCSCCCDSREPLCRRPNRSPDRHRWTSRSTTGRLWWRSPGWPRSTSHRAGRGRQHRRGFGSGSVRLTTRSLLRRHSRRACQLRCQRVGAC